MATRHARTTTPDPRRALASDALRRELAAAVAELRTEPGFRAWLHACANLPRYSPTNVLLIVAQAHRRGLDASHAAPLRTWARLGYRVRAGERGLLIRQYSSPSPPTSACSTTATQAPTTPPRAAPSASAPATSSPATRSTRSPAAIPRRSSFPTRRSTGVPQLVGIRGVAR